jgi:hypothetical protein
MSNQEISICGDRLQYPCEVRPLTTRGRVSVMAKKVVPLPPRPTTPAKTISDRQSRVTVRLGKQRYELDITCQTGVLPAEPKPARGLIKTKFIRTRRPVALAEWIDGWRVCWVGGWDRGKIFFVAMACRPDSER